jgi:trk system potassium uptake protein TrkA
MRYLIVGCGRVGSALAKYLDADGHEVIVVDENASAFKRLGQKFKGHVVVGTGIDYDVLKRAGAATADGFVAVTNGDNRNIMAALIAQRMFKIKRIVARIYDPPRGQMYRELGVQTVCPTTVGAKLIRDVLMEAPWDSLQSFDFGKLSSVSALISKEDAGKKIGDIEEPGRIRIAAVRRASGGVMVASSDMLLEEGDEVNAVVAPEAISEFAQRFHNTASNLTRVTA